MTRLTHQWSRWRGPCRTGHAWTERAYPVACSRCGRSHARAEVRF